MLTTVQSCTILLKSLVQIFHKSLFSSYVWLRTLYQPHVYIMTTVVLNLGTVLQVMGGVNIALGLLVIL